MARGFACLQSSVPDRHGLCSFGRRLRVRHQEENIPATFASEQTRTKLATKLVSKTARLSPSVSILKNDDCTATMGRAIKALKIKNQKALEFSAASLMHRASNSSILISTLRLAIRSTSVSFKKATHVSIESIAKLLEAT